MAMELTTCTFTCAARYAPLLCRVLEHLGATDVATGRRRGEPGIADVSYTCWEERQALYRGVVSGAMVALRLREEARS
jgi:hypothetical protein